MRPDVGCTAAGTMNGVILANLVPTVPFVVLVMTPFIEQIDCRAGQVLVRFLSASFWAYSQRWQAALGRPAPGGQCS
jgi:ABC-type sulfate transport system permease component